MSVLSRFTRKWFRRNQGRPTRLPQQMIKPGLENLEERTVPTVTFSYDGGAALIAAASWASWGDSSMCIQRPPGAPAIVLRS